MFAEARSEKGIESLGRFLKSPGCAVDSPPRPNFSQVWPADFPSVLRVKNFKREKRKRHEACVLCARFWIEKTLGAAFWHIQYVQSVLGAEGWSSVEHSYWRNYWFILNLSFYLYQLSFRGPVRVANPLPPSPPPPPIHYLPQWVHAYIGLHIPIYP